VKIELSKIIHSGEISGFVDGYLEDQLRQRISIVSTNVSPDLKQVRVSVSIRNDRITTPAPTDTTSDTAPTSASQEEKENDEFFDGYDEAEYNDEFDDEYDTDPGFTSFKNNDYIIDQRRAYSWLVKNTKPLRHTLAQKMSHMKTSPNINFAQVDVAAAVDVMNLIDKVSKGYTRETIDEMVPSGVVQGVDLDEKYDEDEWNEMDDKEGDDEDGDSTSFDDFFSK